jgi:transposase
LDAARRFFNRWYFWATHSTLPPTIEEAKMFKKRLENVLTYSRHGVTNAVTEGLDSRIQWIRDPARGFRNRQHLKTAIYFHCGGLDPHPHWLRKNR